MPDVSTPSVTSESDSEISEISSYEAAALRRQDENRKLLESLGLIKVYTVLYIHASIHISIYTVLQESTIPKQKKRHLNEKPLNVSEFVLINTYN